MHVQTSEGKVTRTGKNSGGSLIMQTPALAVADPPKLRAGYEQGCLLLLVR